MKRGVITESDLYVERSSPGRKVRAREVIDRDLTVEFAFSMREATGMYFPGTMRLVNVLSELQFKIETGSGDSEILLATDEQVIYRVDNKISSRAVNGSELGSSKRLLASGDTAPTGSAGYGPAAPFSDV